MIKDYYYRLLSKYISVYARPGDKVLFVEPKSRSILTKFRAEDVLVITSDAKYFDGYRVIQDILSAGQWGPDYIILDGNLQRVADIIEYLEGVKAICTTSTRVIVTYYSMLWRPIISFATFLGLRDRLPYENWIAPEDILNFSCLTFFERVKRQTRILMPICIPFFSNFVNRWISPLPFFNFFALLNFEILRLVRTAPYKSENDSVSIIIPVRNESGNIKAAFERIPVMGPNEPVEKVPWDNSARSI